MFERMVTNAPPKKTVVFAPMFPAFFRSKEPYRSGNATCGLGYESRSLVCGAESCNLVLERDGRDQKKSNGSYGSHKIPAKNRGIQPQFTHSDVMINCKGLVAPRMYCLFLKVAEDWSWFPGLLAGSQGSTIYDMSWWYGPENKFSFPNFDGGSQADRCWEWREWRCCFHGAKKTGGFAGI